MSSSLFDRDFDELSPGLRHRTRGRTITEADVVGFGALTGDLHPQHVDARWSATSRFGERIAHGMLILSYAIGLAPLNPERVLALRKIRDATFKRPVRLGDTIYVEIAVETLSPLPDRLGLVGCVWRVRNQREELVALFRVDALWRSAPDGDADDVDVIQPESGDAAGSGPNGARVETPPSEIGPSDDLPASVIPL